MFLKTNKKPYISHVQHAHLRPLAGIKPAFICLRFLGAAFRNEKGGRIRRMGRPVMGLFASFNQAPKETLNSAMMYVRLNTPAKARIFSIGNLLCEVLWIRRGGMVPAASDVHGAGKPWRRT